ncbi:SLBB domain-containing protein [Microbacter margulisiae]|uniref:Protein involved in polysaccharide export with SLBB domain n=1 Tax=Microbacter margulisiae TaxID=1350067 RepID=A0A7W5DR69_9PORP|nr:SLBB domain-containing protein [Microbacter margulisiae]MBB3187223.1 protein involved in polysaccharide export with SLBB domain [Microbacter margulisiae]
MKGVIFTGKLLSTRFIILVAGILFACAMQAQSLSMLKNVDVSSLSDQQISAIQQKMQSEGVSMNQLDQYAASQGISQNQVDQFKARVVKYNSTRYGVKIRKPNPADTASLFLNRAADTDSVRPLQIFGASIFKNVNLSFEPNLRLATPLDYVLGPDDQLLIDIYGVSEVNYKLSISPDGTIMIPNVGIVNVNGLTIAEARKLIKARLATVYKGITTGNTFVNITLGDIRSITVFVTGEVTYPGSYTVPSLATVYNALYQSGGPKASGSFRDIQLIRDNKVIATIDLYDFLVYGKQNNLRLQDQDVIKVLPYKNRVTLTGEVKHPAIFEMRKGETLQELIDFAGGFTENAYRQTITVYRNTLKEKEVIDVDHANFATFLTQPGDQYTVGKLLNRFENRVQISGAVYRPGVYALTPGMRVKDLILKADGLREDAFVNSAVIFRKNALQLPEMTSFTPKAAMNDSDNVLLQRDDSVYIASVLTMKERDSVDVSGEVITPGTYAYAPGMTLKDLILLSNGFKPMANLAEIVVYRRVTDVKTLNANVIKALSFKVKMDHALDYGAAATFLLKRDDHVVVHAIFGAEDMRQVKVEGEVEAPGNYILLSKNQRISDLVRQAGGLTTYAYAAGAMLIRNPAAVKDGTRKWLEQVTQKTIEKQQREIRDSLNPNPPKDLLQEPSRVSIDLTKILTHPGSSEDLVLEEGDVLSIPRRPETVIVSGEVLMPSMIRYEKGKSLQYYIKHAGGFSDNAFDRKTYVIYSNGSVDATSSFLGIKAYPSITPGAHIVVPTKPMKKGMSLGELLTLSTSLSTLAVVLVTLFKK